MKATPKRAVKPWKLEIAYLNAKGLRAAGRYIDEASATAAALEHVSTCKLVRITGPDGLFADWLDGHFLEGNLREAAAGQPVPPPRHKIDLVFRILRREYQRDRTVRSILLHLAQSRTKAKLII